VEQPPRTSAACETPFGIREDDFDAAVLLATGRGVVADDRESFAAWDDIDPVRETPKPVSASATAWARRLERSSL
jgi:hypothetical protein